MGKGFTPIESYSFFTWRDHSLPSDSHFAENLAIKINDIGDFLISSVSSVFHFCSVPYFIKIRNIGILPYMERPVHHPLAERDIGYSFEMAKVPSIWQSQPFVSLRQNWTIPTPII
jgi:hypothetical protein